MSTFSYFVLASPMFSNNMISWQLFTMDMNWYYSAEYYIDQEAWPARLRPALRDDGFEFEVEKPLSTGGALIIPPDWRPVHEKNISNAMVFRTHSVSEETNKVLQNVADVRTSVKSLRGEVPRMPSMVLVYDPSSGREPCPKMVTEEKNLQNVVNILRGALPNGLMLFKHVPRNRLYLYIGDEIWQWDGDVEVGLKIISKTLTNHVQENIFFCWNNDLRRYLMVTAHPVKCVLDWEVDFDKPNITQLLNEAKKKRVLAYNSTTCLTLTMNIETAKLAVQASVFVT